MLYLLSKVDLPIFGFGNVKKIIQRTNRNGPVENCIKPTMCKKCIKINAHSAELLCNPSDYLKTIKYNWVQVYRRVTEGIIVILVKNLKVAYLSKVSIIWFLTIPRMICTPPFTYFINTFEKQTLRYLKNRLSYKSGWKLASSWLRVFQRILRISIYFSPSSPLYGQLWHSSCSSLLPLTETQRLTTDCDRCPMTFDDLSSFVISTTSVWLSEWNFNMYAMSMVCFRWNT